MNERIRQLAEQAAKFSAIMALPTGESGDKLFVEKFAELIVRACDRYARSAWEHGPLLGKDLLIHFGVEE
jgi:hypothetical protein